MGGGNEEREERPKKPNQAKTKLVSSEALKERLDLVYLFVPIPPKGRH